MRRIRGFNLQEESRRINGLPAVLVTRPGKYGNPYIIGKLNKEDFLFPVTREQAVAYFRLQMEKNRRFQPDLFEEIVIKPLRGKNLACWCKLTETCQADPLLEMVNE